MKLDRKVLRLLFAGGFALVSCVPITHASSGLSEPEASVENGSYVITPGDALTISVYGHDDLRADVSVLPDGTINYPEAGTLHAAGMTVTRLQRTIASKLTILNQPQVTVFVRSSRPRQVSVVGAVHAPGLYDIRPGWRLMEAIAACGGSAQAAELTGVTLITDGGRTVEPIDYIKLMRGNDPSQNPLMRPGDVVVVQPRDPALAQVQVLGSVSRPGLYTVPPDGMSVVALLALVGGAGNDAALTRAQIMHAGQTRQVNLRAVMQHLDTTDSDIHLYAGDVLMVPENTERIAVLGEVHSPGAYTIPDGQTVTIPQALAMANGLNGAADTKSSVIIRPTPGGTPEQIPVDIDSLLKGKSPMGRQLAAGDIFYVPSRRHRTNGGDILNSIPGIAFIGGLLKGGL